MLIEIGCFDGQVESTRCNSWELLAQTETGVGAGDCIYCLVWKTGLKKGGLVCRVRDDWVGWCFEKRVFTVLKKVVVL